MYGKPLAYIVKIKEIREIPGADRIELASVMDYTVVVKKGEYQPGDLGLYVEVDSLLPDGLDAEQREAYERIKSGAFYEGTGIEPTEERIKEDLACLQKVSKYPYFEFLRDKKFKIKSMKLSKFGVVSQGILFKPEDLEITDAKVGKDYTLQFNIETGEWWSLAELTEQEQILLDVAGRAIVEYFARDDVDMDEAMAFADMLYKKYQLSFDKIDRKEYETHLRTLTLAGNYDR